MTTVTAIIGVLCGVVCRLYLRRWIWALLAATSLATALAFVNLTVVEPGLLRHPVAMLASGLAAGGIPAMLTVAITSIVRACSGSTTSSGR